MANRKTFSRGEKQTTLIALMNSGETKVMNQEEHDNNISPRPSTSKNTH